MAKDGERGPAFGNMAQALDYGRTLIEKETSIVVIAESGREIIRASIWPRAKKKRPAATTTDSR